MHLKSRVCFYFIFLYFLFIRKSRVVICEATFLGAGRRGGLFRQHNIWRIEDAIGSGLETTNAIP